MSKIVIYGLGKRFHKYRTFIEEKFPQAVYCDADEKKVREYSCGVTFSYLKEHLQEFERIVFTLNDPVKLTAVIKDLQLSQQQFSFIELEMLKLDRTVAHYYGENNVDAILDTALLSIWGGRLSKIRYLEVGTNNPIGNNNTFHLYTQGAKGILVDALPEVAFLAKWMRPEDTVISKAVIPKRGNDEISFYVSEDIGAGISSVIPDRFTKWGGQQTRRITVPAIYVNDLLESIDFLPDVLLIDAEGLDEQIVRAIQFDRYKVPVLVVEIFDLDHEAYIYFVDFMRQKGYDLYFNSAGINAIFVMKNVLK